MAASYSSSSLSSQIPVYIQKKEDSSFQKYIVCVECEDVPAVVECLSCKDVFCGLCFEWVHKKGKRASHQTKEVQNVPEELRSESKVANKLKSELVIEPAPSLDGGSDIAGTTAHFKRLLEKEREEEEERVSYDIFGSFFFLFLLFSLNFFFLSKFSFVVSLRRRFRACNFQTSMSSDPSSFN